MEGHRRLMWRQGSLPFRPVRDYRFVPQPGGHGFINPRTNTPERWIGLSAFMACELFRQGRTKELSDWLKHWITLSAGTLNMLRVFLTKPAASNNAGRQFPGWGLPGVDTLRAFCAFCATHGLMVEVVLITEQFSNLSWLPGYLTALQQIPNALVEWVNEPSAHDKNTQADLLPWGVDRLPCYSSGDYDPATPWRGHFFTLHPERKSDLWDMASQGKTAVEVYGGGWDTPVGHFNGCHCGCVCDEPGKFEDFQYNLVAIRQFYQGASLMSAGATIHTLESQFCNPPTYQDDLLAPVAFAALNTFPPNVPWLPYSHNTADEHATGSVNTYMMGDYGCRFGPNLSVPECLFPRG